MASKLKQSLLDFQAEMKSQLLSDTFEVLGKTWKMQLLNDEEQTWAVGMMDMSTVSTAGLSGRTANLAIGIREIDGVPIYEYFTDDWEELSKESREELTHMNKYSLKYFVAEHLFSMLAEMPPDVLGNLWESWEVLVKRRTEAQEMSKKSSGETSQQESDES